MPKNVWTEARQEAKDKEFSGNYRIFGSDIDPHAIEVAKRNASKAGVGKYIEFSRADAGAMEKRTPGGVIVTNPPYGERMMERSEAAKLMSRFGAGCAQQEDWKVFVLTSDADFERSFGKTATKKRKLYNGMIKCDLYMYL